MSDSSLRHIFRVTSWRLHPNSIAPLLDRQFEYSTTVSWCCTVLDMLQHHIWQPYDLRHESRIWHIDILTYFIFKTQNRVLLGKRRHCVTPKVCRGIRKCEFWCERCRLMGTPRMFYFIWIRMISQKICSVSLLKHHKTSTTQSRNHVRKERPNQDFQIPSGRSSLRVDHRFHQDTQTHYRSLSRCYCGGNHGPASRIWWPGLPELYF